LNRKALIPLLLVVFMPLAGYFTVKYFSKEAIHMPRRYFYDDVVKKEKNGKQQLDTIWHKVRNMRFVNQLGDSVELDSLKGKILVIDFFFTKCPSICPGLARNMKKLQESFIKNPGIVQFLSISVDPKNDSVAALRKFADRVGANHDGWWFLSGNEAETYKFAFEELKASIADTKVDTAFIHTENFFLLDSNRVVRGWYNGFDTARLAQLATDIPTLMLEKDRSRPSILRGFIPFLPVIFIGIGLTIVAVNLLQRSKRRRDVNSNLEEERSQG
jgi:protein SCO1